MPESAATAPQIVLAFDYGRARIGVACGDTLSRAAQPLTAVPCAGGTPRWESIDALMAEWRPARVVIGLPYNADGSDSAMSGAARGFAAALNARYGLPIALVDERYSSLEAQGRLRSAREAGLRKRRVVKADVDAAAACVILERWFGESR